VRWDWITQTGTKVGQTPPAVFQERVVILDAARREDSTDPVGKADPFGHELCSFPDRAPCILIGFVGDRCHGSDARFAAKPRQQRTQEYLGVDPVRLCATHATVNGHAGRLDSSFCIDWRSTF
jgi:hypothetical protein